jgi:hypothetical protein
MIADLPRRRLLHRVAAMWSEEVGGDIVEAAHHFSQAGEPDRAAGLLTAHADDLVRRGQALAAADLAERLIGRGQPAGSPLLALRGDLLADTVRAAEAEEAYRAALASADPADRPSLGWWLARLLSLRGQPAEAVALCEEAAAAKPAATTGTRAAIPHALDSFVGHSDGTAVPAERLGRQRGPVRPPRGRQPLAPARRRGVPQPAVRRRSLLQHRRRRGHRGDP